MFVYFQLFDEFFHFKLFEGTEVNLKADHFAKILQVCLVSKIRTKIS